MNSVRINNVNADKAGFEALTRICRDAITNSDEAVLLKLCGTFFNASLSAALYPVLKRVQERSKVYLHRNRNARVERILSKNGFFPHLLGSDPQSDVYGTTIEFRVFRGEDEEFFYDYAEKRIIGHRSFPRVSEELRRSVLGSLLELFVNANQHAQSRYGVSSCGQLFPNKGLLELCIADGGIGIPESVRSVIPEISDTDAILWAAEEGNTTRKLLDGIPGGLGLKTLETFVRRNRGKLLLVSGFGYVEISEGSVKTQAMTNPFPGTAAHAIIRTDELC